MAAGQDSAAFKNRSVIHHGNEHQLCDARCPEQDPAQS